MGVIFKPIITEKMAIKGDELGQYGFIVTRDATKDEIRKEVEELYEVTVTSINTMVYGGKSKSRYTKSGIIPGKEKSYKKALVSLSEGETIDFYSNI